MESRRNGPQLSSRHDDDDPFDYWYGLSDTLMDLYEVARPILFKSGLRSRYALMRNTAINSRMSDRVGVRTEIDDRNL